MNIPQTARHIDRGFHRTVSDRHNWRAEIASVWMICGLFIGALGPVSPFMVMSGAAALIAHRPKNLSYIAKAWPIFLLAGIAPLSALWSDAPGVSLRYGLQLSLSIFAVTVMVSYCGAGQFLRSLFIATSVVLLVCVLSGKQGQSKAGPVLIGVLGSKNAMGQLCFMLISSGVCVARSDVQPRVLRSIAPIACFIAGAVLINSFASGALISTVLFIALYFLISKFRRMRPIGRSISGFTLVAIAALALIFNGTIADGYNWFIGEVLHKDPGLTGRDYLWARADRLISEQPLLGHGFRSAWLSDGTNTIGLLRWAGLTSGLGFNFHNTVRELLVDFGFLGTALFLCVLGIGLLKIVASATKPTASTEVVFLATLGLVTVVRCYAETLIGPFNEASLAVIAIPASGYLFAKGAAAKIHMPVQAHPLIDSSRARPL